MPGLDARDPNVGQNQGIQAKAIKSIQAIEASCFWLHIGDNNCCCVDVLKKTLSVNS